VVCSVCDGFWCLSGGEEGRSDWRHFWENVPAPCLRWTKLELVGGGNTHRRCFRSSLEESRGDVEDRVEVAEEEEETVDDFLSAEDLFSYKPPWRCSVSPQHHTMFLSSSIKRTLRWAGGQRAGA
jgi:hypothetical protein